MKKFEEKSTSSTPIFSGRVISLKVDEVILPNGKSGKREIINHPGAVSVLAITDEHKIVFVEQYRKALERSIIEIPAGKLDPGEAPIDCAKRELEEETGYITEDISFLQSFATSPGFADEVIHLFVAKNLQVATNKKALDEDEFVELIEMTIEEAEAKIATNEIFDAKTILAIYWAKLNLKSF